MCRGRSALNDAVVDCENDANDVENGFIDKGGLIRRSRTAFPSFLNIQSRSSSGRELLALVTPSTRGGGLKGGMAGPPSALPPHHTYIVAARTVVA